MRPLEVLGLRSWDDASALATTLGIVVAGVWTYLLFVRKRERFPRAKVDHRVTWVVLGDNQLLLHVTVCVKNLGSVLMSLHEACTWIQQILPISDHIRPSLEAHDALEPTGEAQIPWPWLARREPTWTKGALQIEPGEEDFLEYDFLLPNDIRVIEIYSYLRNAQYRGKTLGWSNTTIIELTRNGLVSYGPKSPSRHAAESATHS